ncbi:MAG: response regulator [Dehalococcoidales bacterium]|jgi:two-component system response regulator (stage 0 sporulation protein F)
MTEATKILVVDDNADLRDTLYLILKRRGFDVDRAGDGRAAVDKIENQHFDVVLMDIIMPDMNGMEAFRKIREIDRKVKIILMTAYYEEEELKTALNEGVYQTVHKPVEVARLIEMIKEAAKNPQILIVDDDPDFCYTMTRTLELKGYPVMAAGSGEEAIRLAGSFPFQVAFVDVKLPQIDGLDTCLQLKDINSDIVVIMMTAYREEVGDRVEKALASSAATCLYKPFDPAKAMYLVSLVEER